ncbi:MAG: hypothetical protein H6651_00090 [Ardenticatenales bacterium]|nr:hypothetical protein [Ardenticatenales bacterium]
MLNQYLTTLLIPPKELGQGLAAEEVALQEQKSSAAGRVMTTAPAISNGQLVASSWLMSWRPTGAV